MSTALAVGTISWGLIGVGAAAHLRHPGHLADLLRVHTQHAAAAARVLTGVETAIAVAVVVGLIGGVSAALQTAAIAGAALGVGFTAWVLRLYLSDSDLPCACSWSTAPTSAWSVARAVAVVPVGLLVFVGEPGGAQAAASLVIGAAAGTIAFLVPEALAWPEESIRLRDLARSESAV